MNVFNLTFTTWFYNHFIKKSFANISSSLDFANLRIIRNNKRYNKFSCIGRDDIECTCSFRFSGKNFKYALYARIDYFTLFEEDKSSLGTNPPFERPPNIILLLSVSKKYSFDLSLLRSNPLCSAVSYVPSKSLSISITIS